MLSYLPFFSRDPFMLYSSASGPFLCLAFLPDGSTLSSGREPPNFCPGGAVGLRIESKTGRSTFFFRRTFTSELYQIMIFDCVA